MQIREYNTASDVALIFMSGYGKRDKEESNFEWEASSNDFPENRFFVINVLRVWYHDCLETLIPLLKQKTEGKKVLAIGASMGGYGALAVAHALNCGSLTFGAQTNIKVDFLAQHDNRWMKNCRVANEITMTPEYLDLSFIKGAQHHLFYASRVPQDVIHATRMDVSLFPIDCEEHNVAGYLKRKGLLAGIIRQRIQLMKGA